MPSQRLAVGAETDPLMRARQLQRSWERLLADGALGPELPQGATAGLRPTIVESWRRSLAGGLDPTDLLAPIEADESEVLEHWFEHPLGSLTDVLTEQLREIADESRSIVVVTDASGLVMHRVGDEWLKERAAEMNLVEGARYSEAADGTNGIGTALAADHAFQVFAFEHFNERHHHWVCSGAPVHDPVTGRTIGLIDLSSLWKVAHPRSLELVTTAAGTIDQGLRDARRDRNARLRRRYGDFMSKGSDLLVDRDGYVLEGAEPSRPGPLEIPEGGGEVVLADGSVALAAPLGQGEAYLLRRGAARRGRSGPRIEGSGRTRELATEQAALRQVATLVARESSPEQLFAAVTEQVARILDVPHVRLIRYEPDGSVVVGGFSEGDDEPFPIGSRWSLDTPGVAAVVRQTGRPARVEDYADLPGEIAAVVRGAGMRSAVASPIVVERRLWGAIVVLSPRREPLPGETEARLTDFTELVATAIANAESRQALAQLADEQAALRRVATLVARESSPVEIFGAVTEEARRVLESEAVGLLRFEPDGTATLVAQSETPWDPPPLGTVLPLDGDNVVVQVSRTGQASRVDDWAGSTGSVAAMANVLGVRSAVASPVVVEGHLWGTIIAASQSQPLPAETEFRTGEFTRLVATAIANAAARGELSQLLREQAALRRVAVLVAQQPSPDEVFTAVTEAVGPLLGADLAAMHVFRTDGSATVVASWSEAGPALPTGTQLPLDGDSAVARIFRTAAAARIDGYAEAEGETADVARGLRLRSAVGAPILVEGRLWGALMAAARGEEPLPPEAEARIAAFTELVATAVSNAQAREQVTALADEQAALRRVATLVAEDAPSTQLFHEVTLEVGTLLGADFSGMARLADAAVVPVAAWAAEGEHPPLPERWPMQSGDPVTAIAEAQSAVRWDDWTAIDEPIAAFIREELGVRSTVGTPIAVEGRVWGVLAVHSRQSLPQDAELRMEQFSDLVATAIANAEARAEVARLADEQAALRRVATLVAIEASHGDVFTAIVDGVSGVLGEELRLVRFEGDHAVVVAGSDGPHNDVLPVGSRLPIGGSNALSHVFRTGEPARIDDYSSASGPIAEAVRPKGLRSVIATPIIVEGRPWGAMIVGAFGGESVPPDTEHRLGQFADLMATAIANADARVEIERLAEQQAALRRVATLVARRATPEVVFRAVAEEAGGLVSADFSALLRLESDDTATVMAGPSAGPHAAGERVAIDPGFVVYAVRETRRPTRFETDDPSAAGMPDLVRRLGMRSAVASPIVVDGALWGAVILGSVGESFPPETEQRLDDFTELVATGISNATARAELVASRARIVAASDESRRRIERDLHDGTQQRLVSLGLALRAAETNAEREDLRAELSRIAEGLIAAVEDLQEISRGIHPAILTKGGLSPALQTLAHRSPIPVDLDITTEARLAEPIEAAAYFVASEALANAAKHSKASRIDLSLAQSGRRLLLSIRDDGVGGADRTVGSGLVGLTDRVEALGGSIHVHSPQGEGTKIAVDLPVELEAPQPVD